MLFNSGFSPAARAANAPPHHLVSTNGRSVLRSTLKFRLALADSHVGYAHGLRDGLLTAETYLSREKAIKNAALSLIETGFQNEQTVLCELDVGVRRRAHLRILRTPKIISELLYYYMLFPYWSKAVDAVNAVKAKASGPRTQYLNIMTTRKGQRVRVPLKGFVPGSLFDGKPREDNTMKLEASTIHIIRTERGFKAVFQHDFKTLDPLPVPPPKTALFEAMNLPATMKLLRIVGLDLGVTEVFTDDDGNHWGGSEDYVVEPGRHRKGMMDARQDEAVNGQIKTRTGYMPGLNALMRKFAQYRDEKLRRRNELRDQAKNTKDPVKRRNIEKNNLGSKAFDKKCAAYKAAITQIVNRAINRLFLKNPADVYVLECFGSSFDLSGFSKKTRRYLSS